MKPLIYSLAFALTASWESNRAVGFVRAASSPPSLPCATYYQANNGDIRLREGFQCMDLQPTVSVPAAVGQLVYARPTVLDQTLTRGADQGGCTKLVTIDLLPLKGDDISWAYCKQKDCHVVDCSGSLVSAASGFPDGFSASKCETVSSITVQVDASVTSVTIQVHDGKAAGTVDCSAPGVYCAGGSPSSCANAGKVSGVCEYVLPIAPLTCPSPPPPDTRDFEDAVAAPIEPPATSDDFDGDEASIPCASQTDCSQPPAFFLRFQGTPCAYNLCVKEPGAALGVCVLSAFEPGYDATELMRECRPAEFSGGDDMHTCDLPEFCDGTSMACPEDRVKTFDTHSAAEMTCRTSKGDCDRPEFCSGSSADKACAPDAKYGPLPTAFEEAESPAGVEAQEGATESPEGPCFGAHCFETGPMAGTYMCRPAAPAGGDADAGVTCDVPEFCNGVDDDCPQDRVKTLETHTAAEMTCRTSKGACDKSDLCTGQPSDKSCSDDVKYGPGVHFEEGVHAGTHVCRDYLEGKHCDMPEVCTGRDDHCPDDNEAVLSWYIKTSTNIFTCGIEGSEVTSTLDRRGRVTGFLVRGVNPGQGGVVTPVDPAATVNWTTCAYAPYFTQPLPSGFQAFYGRSATNARGRGQDISNFALWCRPFEGSRQSWLPIGGKVDGSIPFLRSATPNVARRLLQSLTNFVYTPLSPGFFEPAFLAQLPAVFANTTRTRFAADESGPGNIGTARTGSTASEASVSERSAMSRANVLGAAIGSFLGGCVIAATVVAWVIRVRTRRSRARRYAQAHAAELEVDETPIRSHV